MQNYIFLDYDVSFAFGFLSDLSFKHSGFNEIVNFFSFHWHPTITKDCFVALCLVVLEQHLVWLKRPIRE